MKLHKLISILPEISVSQYKDVDIHGITDDSRKVDKDFVFVAVSGANYDGHNYIDQAIEKGAIVVVGEKAISKPLSSKAIYLQVKNSRESLGLLASKWNDEPSKKLRIIGVTGTDGKTTTSTMIYWLLKAAGKKVGLISTVSAKIAGKDYDTGFHVTNPDSPALQSFLKKMVESHCEYAVLEVTSHGLDQERVAGVNFNIGVLTNITHEHIDYHKTFDNYLKAKTKLFQRSEVSILNKLDKSSKKIIASLHKKAKIIEYDMGSLPARVQAAIKSRFKEEYNCQNATAAIYVAKKVGIDDEIIISAITSFPGVEGRMQEIDNDRNIRIIVDFAHTPNALENVLITLKKQVSSKNKLICVFGCAGERDIQKRPMMGEIAGKIADISVFTAEDPRFEDIDDITQDMLKGFNKNVQKDATKNVVVIPERGEAINIAINKLAKPGDVVVVCGKGHEKSMNYNGVEYPWSDQEAVSMALQGKIYEIAHTK